MRVITAYKYSTTGKLRDFYVTTIVSEPITIMSIDEESESNVIDAHFYGNGEVSFETF